jgi:hypothetical protein
VEDTRLTPRVTIRFLFLVSTVEFEDRISDADMHSHTPYEQKFAKYRNPKQLADEMKSEYWLNNAKAFVEEQVKRMPNKNQAKNIIMVGVLLVALSTRLILQLNSSSVMACLILPSPRPVSTWAERRKSSRLKTSPTRPAPKPTVLISRCLTQRARQPLISPE